jgi:hypothetical protein
VKTWAVINDIQILFHDEKVLDLVVNFIRELKPYGVVLNGDIVDCYSISSYSKDPMKKSDIVLEQRLARNLMACLGRPLQGADPARPRRARALLSQWLGGHTRRRGELLRPAL